MVFLDGIDGTSQLFGLTRSVRPTPAGGGDSLASTRCVCEPSPWTVNLGAIERFRFGLFAGGGSPQAPRYVVVGFVHLPRGPAEQRLPR